MLKRPNLLALLLLGLCTILGAAEKTPHQVIFKCSAPISVKSDRTGLTEFDSYLNQLGAYNIRPIKGMHSPVYYLAQVSTDPDWESLSKGSLRFKGIEYMQPNNLNTLHMVPNDPLYNQQFHEVVSDPQAWNYTTGSSQVVVGVVDSGCLIDHPDLATNIWVNPREIPGDGIDNDNNGYIDDINGWDFTDAPEFSDTAIGDYLEPDNDVTDENFHGTHVAGIIGATGNNAVGVAGVAWNVKLMPIRAGFRTTAGQGTLQDDDAAAALIYAADNGCQVINMSWGDPSYSPIIGDACDYAYSKGVTLVASAGNDPGPYLSYPAKLSSVIAVGAINKSMNIAGFSSYGIDMELVAPGELVLSTYKLESDQLYFTQSGTSMSSPFVAGAVALLLSLHPGLSPAEVRARLLTSTDDLGDPGVDVKYGHGLLNTRKLLENTNPPLVYIDQPVEQCGLTGSVDITGTVTGADFFRYSVMYSLKEVPSSLDWYDVTEHTNYPVFHTQQVSNGVLAEFIIPEAFPEGPYSLRIEYQSNQGGKYLYYRNVSYDRSIPELKVGTLQGFKRYDKQNLRYYIAAIFNEPVRSELLITASDSNVYRCYGAKMDTLHVWAIPPNVPEGSIDISYRVTNSSNLTLISQLVPDFMTIQYRSIPNIGFSYNYIGPARVPLNSTFDYNNDGYPEYLAMDLPTSGYGFVYSYQPQTGGHVVTHAFNDSFWLLGAGNTDATGQEILQLKADTAILLESQAGQQYPNLALWQETSITGGTIADYSGDGVQDLLLIKNLPLERVIQAYKRSTGEVPFAAKNTLHNTSATSLRNTFVPTLTVKNFDNDNFLDILAADTDGDVMIYEIRNDNLSDLSWSTRLPVGNTYSITSGDFDGNGHRDFMIGGYYRDVLDANQNFWYFEGFRNVTNNSYTSMGSIMFNDVISQNSIQATDLDNNGKDEVILAIAPNLYILKYENGEFVPSFRGNSFRTYNILTYKDANQRPFFLTNYEVAPDSVVAVEWTSEDPYTGPPIPANFLATPHDEQSVDLSWIANGANHYRIHRRDEDGFLTLIDNLTGSTYRDTGLVEGMTYSYAVSAVNNVYNPPEGEPSSWVEATPYHVPNLVSCSMISSNEVRLIFDQAMATSALNPILYTLSHGIGHPTSINMVDGNLGLQLHFNVAFPAITDDFTLDINNLYSAKGVLIQTLSCQFPFLLDTDVPRIETVTLLPDGKSVLIKLSETIASFNPNPDLLLNYQLRCPSNDSLNYISSVLHQDDQITLTFASKLKHTNTAYFVTINNLRDLAGNVISPRYNVARISLNIFGNLKNVTVYPNPVLVKNQSICKFINFPTGKAGSIKIFNSAGNLVLTSAIGPFNTERNDVTWQWDLLNYDKRRVSSGVYFYVIEMDGEIARGKLAIIN